MKYDYDEVKFDGVRYAVSLKMLGDSLLKSKARIKNRYAVMSGARMLKSKSVDKFKKM